MNSFGVRIVTTQEDLDRLVSERYNGLITIIGGTAERPLRLNVRTQRRARAAGTAYVTVAGNAHIRATDGATIRAHEHADVVAFDDSFVSADGRAKVQLHGTARALIKGRVRLKTFARSKAHVYGCRSCIARGNSEVLGFENVTMHIWQHARAWCFQRSHAYAEDATARVITR